MFARGDFSFIQDKSTRLMLEEAFETVEKLGVWEELKSKDVPGDGGYMFSTHPLAKKIADACPDTVGHSGSSWGWTMRQIDYIAKDGWDAYVAICLKKAAENNKTLQENNDKYLKRINSLESRVFTLEDEVRALKAKLAALSNA